MKRIFLCLQLVIYSLVAQEIASLDLSYPAPLIVPQEGMAPEPIYTPPKKNAFLAAVLSSLIPGLGHFYIDDPRTGGAFLGSAVATGSLVYAGRNNENILLPGLFLFSNICSSYNVYAAYRDARFYNGLSHYSYPMPTDSLATLATAPFRWSVLKKPEVWGGILGGLTAAGAVAYFAFSNKEAVIHHHFSPQKKMPFLALPVGIGEEALFRGYFQSAIAEATNPWTGIILSSLAFGAAHIPNAQALDKTEHWRYYSFSIPLITCFGIYAGWLTSKTHSLQESVAVHTWYDATLFTLGAFAAQSMLPGEKSFAIAIPF